MQNTQRAQAGKSQQQSIAVALAVLLLGLAGALRAAPSHTAHGCGQLSHADSVDSAHLDSSRHAECSVIMEASENFLSPIDVVVKNEDNDINCIRARFALSIKVEGYETAAQQNGSSEMGATTRVLTRLGYLPLENVIKVENTCPDQQSFVTTAAPGQKADAKRANSSANEHPLELQPNPNELEMIITFECGKLSFTFQRDENKYFMSSIKGLVKLDRQVKQEFSVKKPMFLTSDLTHRFKYDNLIEVSSEMTSQNFILSANFYSTEIEVFRNTASRDFIKPPDLDPKPFSDNK